MPDSVLYCSTDLLLGCRSTEVLTIYFTDLAFKPALPCLALFVRFTYLDTRTLRHVLTGWLSHHDTGRDENDLPLLVSSHFTRSLSLDMTDY